MSNCRFGFSLWSFWLRFRIWAIKQWARVGWQQSWRICWTKQCRRNYTVPYQQQAPNPSLHTSAKAASSGGRLDDCNEETQPPYPSLQGPPCFGRESCCLWVWFFELPHLPDHTWLYEEEVFSWGRFPPPPPPLSEALLQLMVPFPLCISINSSFYIMWSDNCRTLTT